jgi:hypothetical protein
LGIDRQNERGRSEVEMRQVIFSAKVAAWEWEVVGRSRHGK